MRKSDFKVAFCYNVHPENVSESEDEEFAEFDSADTIDAITKSLEMIGFIVKQIEYSDHFVEDLKSFNPDLVFNIVEGFKGLDREAQAPAIYEFLGLKYTGSGPLAHALALDKAMAKRVMEYCGVKTAPFVVFESKVSEDQKINICLPAIIKPVREGSSIGIHNDAIARTPQELREKINKVVELFNQPALVEEYIQGREFNQAMIGNENPLMFPIVEIDYSYLPEGIEKFSSYEVKTSLDDPNSTICPARITDEERIKITNAVLASNRALGIRDYSRVDLRMDDHGEVYILEINSIPGIAPGIKENNSMTKAIREYGWTYGQMIKAIVDAALERYQIFFES